MSRRDTASPTRDPAARPSPLPSSRFGLLRARYALRTHAVRSFHAISAHGRAPSRHAHLRPGGEHCQQLRGLSRAAPNVEPVVVQLGLSLTAGSVAFTAHTAAHDRSTATRRTSPSERPPVPPNGGDGHGLVGCSHLCARRDGDRRRQSHTEPRRGTQSPRQGPGTGLPVSTGRHSLITLREQGKSDKSESSTCGRSPRAPAGTPGRCRSHVQMVRTPRRGRTRLLVRVRDVRELPPDEDDEHRRPGEREPERRRDAVVLGERRRRWPTRSPARRRRRPCSRCRPGPAAPAAPPAAAR